MKKVKYIVLGAVILTIFILLSCTYVVYEDEVAVIKTFGKVEAIVINAEDAEAVYKNLNSSDRENDIKVITEKGLHFKIPFVQSVEIHTSKNLTYQSASETINTKDDKKIEISMYAQYRIVDPLKFKLTIGDTANVRMKMDNRVYPVVIQSANNIEFNEFFELELLNQMVEEKREELNQELINDFGIFVTHIGINKKNFPSTNISAIENKMAMQIEKESEKLIAEGDSIYQQEKSKTDRERIELLSIAKETAADTKAEADTEVLKIYQEALQKDLSFYKFIQRMEIYKTIKDTTIFIDKDNDLISGINGYN